MATTENQKNVEILLKKFKESQLKNPRWSQRAFAKKLGVSSGALSEIMNGKRSMSPQLKKKIVSVLHLSPTEQLDFFGDDIPLNLKPVRHEYFRLSVDQFHLISDWWHFAILNLIRTKGFKAQHAWIAERLGIPLKVVSESWDRLFRLGHLKRSKSTVVRVHPKIETTDDFFDLSIRKAHVEDLKLIEKSILNGSTEKRDHTSITLVVNNKNIKKAKELIRLFQDQFSELVEVKNNEAGDEVYRLSISFYPLTQIKESP
jgi:transcriptional regulator with XRE-family HTH domain